MFHLLKIVTIALILQSTAAIPVGDDSGHPCFTKQAYSQYANTDLLNLTPVGAESAVLACEELTVVHFSDETKEVGYRENIQFICYKTGGIVYKNKGVDSLGCMPYMF